MRRPNVLDRSRTAAVGLLILAPALFSAGCRTGTRPLVRLPEQPAQSVLIRDVGVLDVESSVIAPHRDVLVTNGRIVSIGDTGLVPAPAGAQSLSKPGATLLPGLIDMHGHIGGSSNPPWLRALPDPDANMLAYLYCGVTTVLDPADIASAAFERRAEVAAGELLGPTIFASGPMVTVTGGHPVPVMKQLLPWFLRWYLIPRFTWQVDTIEEGREAGIEIAALGADVVKLSVDRIPAEAPRIANDVLAAVVVGARSKGVRAVAHIGTTQDAIDAADAGVSAWMHGVYQERIPDPKIAALAGYQIPMVVTMVVFESYALMRERGAPTALERETVPAEVLAAFAEIPADVDLSAFGPYIEHLRSQRANWRDNIRRLRAAGVTILAGSDTQTGVFPGAGLHRELHLLAETGMTPAEIIRAATIDSARFLANGKPPDFGFVAAGARADLLLVAGDPTADLDALDKIEAVIKDGIVLERLPLGS